MGPCILMGPSYQHWHSTERILDTTPIPITTPHAPCLAPLFLELTMYKAEQKANSLML